MAAKRVAVAALAALMTACMARMPMPGDRGMPEMPEMPDEQEFREMLDRSMGKPTVPDQPDESLVQVVFQTGHAGAITAVALSRDGRYIVSTAGIGAGMGDETVRLWDVASGQEVRAFPSIDYGGETVAFVGDTRRIAIGGLVGAKLIDGETGRMLDTIDDRMDQAVISGSARYAAQIRMPGMSDTLRNRPVKRVADGIVVVDLATDRVVAALKSDMMTAPLEVSDDGRIVLTKRVDEEDQKRMEQALRSGRQYSPLVRVDVWDAGTGRKLSTLPVDGREFVKSTLNADGTSFAVETLDQQLRVYDVASGALRWSISAVSTGYRGMSGATSLVFSPDGRMLGRASADGRVLVWQMPEGRLVTEFAGTAVNFSADGRQLVGGKAGGGAPFLRDLATGNERALAGGASAISDLAIVGDGSSVVAATETSGARFWNLASGELLRTFSCPGGASAYSVSASSAARWVATGCMDGAAYVWNLDTGVLLRTVREPLGTRLGTQVVVRFDRSGRRLAVGRNDELSVWDVAENRELKRLTLPEGPLPSFMQPDQMVQTMENAPESQRAMMDEIANNPEYQRAQQAIRALEFHPDGEHIAVIKAASMSLWNLNAGTQVREYSRAGRQAIQAQVQEQQSTSANAQQELMAKLMSGKRLSKKELEALQNMGGGGMGAQVLMGGREDMQDAMADSMGSTLMASRSLAFSREGSVLHVLATTGPQAWEVATGRMMPRQRSSQFNPMDPMSFLENQETGVGFGLALSPDGRYGARGFGRMIKVWDLSTGDVVGELLGHTSDITSVAYAKGGRLLVSGARDGSVRVWSTTEAREVAQLLAFGASDYVAVTPDQFYRTSRRGIGGVAFRVGGKLYPFEQFDLRFNRPDVILERLGGTPPAVVQGYRAAYQRRLKKLGFTEDMLGGEFHLPEVQLAGQVPVTTEANALDLQIRASDSKYPLDRVNVFVNDVPVYGTAGIPLTDRASQAHEQSIRVPLVAGRNKVQVSVLNQQGAESLRQTAYTTSTAPAVTPDVYIVAIGVSRYQRESYNLRFAAKDAADLTNAYRNLAQRPGSVGNVHVLELTDAKATRTSIREARGWLEQARVGDLVVLFAAGHGMTDTASNYYFGTYDIDPEQPARAGLPYEEFEALLDGIPAMQKLMLIDTCFSGEIDKDEPVAMAQADTGGAGVVQMRAFKAARGISVVADAPAAAVPGDVVRFQQELFADLRRGTGAVVISSASGNEYALEGEQWANGVFTYALLDGLRNGRADANADQVISVSELQAHVLEEVRRLTAGGQNPTVRRENLEYDFRVY